LLVACGLLATLACSPPSSEEQVGRLIEAAERAAENRDPAALGEMLSDRFRDASGNGKREILGLLRYEFTRHGSVHLLTRVRSIESAAPGSVEAVVFVAVADVEIRDARTLESIQADLLRFDLNFAEEQRGKWRVAAAAWRGLRPADFL
jgi:hypothetical protein